MGHGGPVEPEATHRGSCPWGLSLAGLSSLARNERVFGTGPNKVQLRGTQDPEGPERRPSVHTVAGEVCTNPQGFCVTTA